MSNLWFNIRIGRWFFQSGPDKWFSLSKLDSWIPDDYYKGPVGIYCLFGRHFG